MKKLIGYAADNLTLGSSASKTVRLKNAAPETIRSLIKENLRSLKSILEWNAAHDIRMYRINSNLIPYASHPVNTVNWATEFQETLHEIGGFINERQMVVSMHPGQYTVLSSADPGVRDRSIAEIEYHASLLSLLEQQPTAKIILHVGGAYGDKAAAMLRWVENFRALSENARRRVVIENDDKTYTVAECLYIFRDTRAPVVFDILHHKLNRSDRLHWRGSLVNCASTWPEGTTPEVHYSNQAKGQPHGVHSDTIDVDSFLKFWDETKDLDFNVMLETKDKERSVLKVREVLRRMAA